VEVEWKMLEAGGLAASITWCMNRGWITKFIAATTMKTIDLKFAEAKRECAQSLRPTPTPLIPDLALKPGTGTALRTPVPANLDIPDVEPRNPDGMSAEQVAFLCLLNLPAILNAWQAAILLGLTEANVPVLVRLGLLEPLVHGRGIPCKFSLPYIKSIGEDHWKLFEITNALIDRSVEKNRKSKKANP
jgi:hypothetical protein